ncbi:MAG: hypothetical protein HC884_05095 [Chloroflexaceae bacterium]|nr:hypothetical protein [Chloroflexaceae bacterium]
MSRLPRPLGCRAAASRSRSLLAPGIGEEGTVVPGPGDAVRVWSAATLVPSAPVGVGEGSVATCSPPLEKSNQTPIARIRKVAVPISVRLSRLTGTTTGAWRECLGCPGVGSSLSGGTILFLFFGLWSYGFSSSMMLVSR